jgi:hypothetical protein
MHQWRYGFIIPAAKKTVAKTDVKLKLLYENSPPGAWVAKQKVTPARRAMVVQ